MANELKQFRDDVVNFINNPTTASEKKKGTIIVGNGLKMTKDVLNVTYDNFSIGSVSSTREGAMWYTIIAGGASAST